MNMSTNPSEPTALSTSGAPPRPIARPAFDPLDPQWQTGRRALESEGAEAEIEAPLSPEERHKREQAGTQVMAARLAWKRGDKAGAQGHLQQAFAVDDTDCGGLDLLGDILLEEAEQEKAIAVFERGLKYHPRFYAFEEKIALAYLDLQEMAADRERATMLLSGDPDRWQDRKPGVALSVALLVPGAGHFYNDENERGGALLGTAVFTFAMWYWMLSNATRALPGRQIMTNLGGAIASMSGVPKAWFWLNLLAWTAIWLYSAIDAYQGTERANRARRRVYGV